MNSALSYLLWRRLSNTVKGLMKRPGTLVYVICLALVVFSAGMNGDAGAGTEGLNRQVFYGFLILFYAIVYVVTAKAGLSGGASFFSMADANLIFTGPVDNRRVLFHGLFQGLGTAALLGLVLVFQYAWLNNLFGVTAADMAALIVGYVVVMFLGQLSAMGLYIMANGSERRSVATRAVFYTVVGAFAAYFVVRLVVLNGDMPGNILTTATNVLGDGVMRLFPVGGWVGALAMGVMGEPLYVVPAVLLGVFLIAAAVLVASYKGEYYEDVLDGAEAAESAITAKKEGRQNDILPKRVRVGKTGIGHGRGASAFYYKSMVEMRRYRIFILNGLQLIFGAVLIGMAVLMKEGIYAVFFTGLYLQMFTAGTGGLSREFERPYIYMAPYPSFTKLVMCLMEPLIGTVIEAVVVFVPVCLICGCTPLDTLLWVALRISCGLMFIGGSLITERVFGSVNHKTYVMFFYILVCMIMLIPAAVAAIFAIATQALPLALGMGLICVINVGVAALAVFLCRNMLNDGAAR